MARPLVMIYEETLPSTLHIGVAVMTLLVCAIVLLMCASHSSKWSSCYGIFEEEPEPIIEINNQEVMLGTNSEQQEVSLWRKNILMGGKCQLPDFSGVIIYDSEGNIVTPAKPSPPLLTWK
ncbi:hypothetical protein L6164_007000 [Bauhinia variegata]|uniref:Uncharacterized protein n=1 Tax=Bauhinia variegata TaxID=167791 RepID=A0ACB9PVJ0_BAUVA|nr:hypothetical protein L6164_007000 [Bauhinia variegata]